MATVIPKYNRVVQDQPQQAFYMVSIDTSGFLDTNSNNAGSISPCVAEDFATAPTTSLSNLNASNLTSGTVPNARFPSTLPAVSGSALTGIKQLKAFVNLKGTGTVSIRQSFNVSSITDNEVGGYQVNFTNNMSSSNYIITHCISQDNANHNSHGCCYIRNSTVSTSSFKSRTFDDNSSGQTVDKVMVSFMVIEN